MKSTSKQSEQTTNQRNKAFIGLTGWIFIALILGIIIGIVFNYTVPSGSDFDNIVVNGIFYVLGQGFIRLMQMLVAPLVFCSIVCGAAAIGNGKTLGRVGGLTIVLYIITTAVAVCMALVIAQFIQPGVGLDLSSIHSVDTTSTQSTSVADTILNIIPTNAFNALSSGSMLQIIFFALILGVILAQLGDRVSTVRRFFSQFNEVMMSMVTLVLRVAPIGVFCLISRTFAHLGLDAIVPMLKFVGGTYLGLAFQLCVVYMVLLRVFARLNPFRFLKKMLPVMGFAFSTSSSNATIPLNINTLEKKVGVNPKIASFTIPLGATINMDGTAIMQGVAVVFVAQAFGIPLGPMEYMTVILTATLASIGTAGVPGVGTIMLAMVFDAVGLPAEGISMIMGVDRIVDMGRTAINVTGDAVVTAIVARANKALNTDVFNDIVTDQNVEAQEEQRTALEQGDLDALSDNETTVSDKDEN
ncbi:MAG: dicarboxylate/amino acid:cation symporter [Eggerthellaceae bacterium]|jgi:Na+/H+-dicarboxylate symporter|nr:dicarboxylate/amino acid:cation symporter [Eggerthellaceae bacterium]